MAAYNANDKGAKPTRFSPQYHLIFLLISLGAVYALAHCKLRELRYYA